MHSISSDTERLADLALIDDDREDRLLIDDVGFAQFFRRRSLRLVVIYACNSAQAEGLFSGMGPARGQSEFLRIAMQRPFVRLDTASLVSRNCLPASPTGFP